jgi:hypothetical protein
MHCGEKQVYGTMRTYGGVPQGHEREAENIIEKAIISS